MPTNSRKNLTRPYRCAIGRKALIMYIRPSRKCNRKSIRQHQPVCKRKEKMITWLHQYQANFPNVDAPHPIPIAREYLKVKSGRRAIGKKHEGVAATGGQMQKKHLTKWLNHQEHIFSERFYAPPHPTPTARGRCNSSRN